MGIDSPLPQQPLQHGGIGILLADAEAGGVAGANRYDIERPRLQRRGDKSDNSGDEASPEAQNHWRNSRPDT